MVRAHRAEPDRPSGRVGEPRRALLEVRLHRLDLVRAAHQLALQAFFEREAVAARAEPALLEQLLAGADRVRGLRGDLARQLERAVARRVAEAGGEPERDRLRARDDA